MAALAFHSGAVPVFLPRKSPAAVAFCSLSTSITGPRDSNKQATLVTTPAVRGRPVALVETEPERRKQQLRNAMAVEGFTVTVWLLVSLFIYVIATKQALSGWLLLPPLREACKGVSNIINYGAELAWVWREA